PLPPEEVKTPRLVLEGDSYDFDNTVYFVPPRREPLAVVYLGRDDTGDAKGLRFYFESAVDSAGSDHVELVFRTPEAPELLPTDKKTHLVVVATTPSREQRDTLRAFVRQGGQLLYVLTSAEQGKELGELLEVESLSLTEAEVSGYTMLKGIDFTHPMFASMASPQFSDFTQIRFWKYRQLDLQQLPEARVVATFERGDPAIVE